MLIPVQVPSIQYYYTAGSTSLAIPWTFYEEDYIKIAVKEPGAKYTEIYPLVEGTDFTVEPQSDVPTDGGRIKLLRTFPVNTLLEVYRLTDIEQMYKYTELDEFPAESHENGLGRRTSIEQELAYAISRALRVPYGSDDDPDEILAMLENLKDYVERAEEAARKACECAAWAKKWATNPYGEEVIDGLYSAYHWARYAEELVVSREVYGGRARVWRINSDIKKGDTITVPVEFYAKSAVLYLSYNGLTVFPKLSYGEIIEGTYQYEEVGEVAKLTNKIIIHFDVPGPSIWYMWVSDSGAIGPAPDLEFSGQIIDDEYEFKVDSERVDEKTYKINITSPDLEIIPNAVFGEDVGVEINKVAPYQYRMLFSIPKGEKGDTAQPPEYNFTVVVGDFGTEATAETLPNRDSEGNIVSYEVRFTIPPTPLPKVYTDIQLGEKWDYSLTSTEDGVIFTLVIGPVYGYPKIKVLKTVYQPGEYSEIKAGDVWTTPRYYVGRDSLRVLVDGLEAYGGPNDGFNNYAEVGVLGETSTSITWWGKVKNTHQIALISKVDTTEDED